MSLAPDPYRSACLEVVYRALLNARVIGWSGQRSWRGQRKRLRQIADLMDAVHNIPQLLNCWEHVDRERLRGDLSEYDRKWGADSWYSLAATYEAALSNPSDRHDQPPAQQGEIRSV